MGRRRKRCRITVVEEPDAAPPPAPGPPRQQPVAAAARAGLVPEAMRELQGYEVSVTAAFALSSEADATQLRYRLEHLQQAEGIAAVDVEPAPDGARVRAGPFVLRRAGAPEGSVPPALLWCFACLSVEEGEEPCVTFDESDATIGFLEAVQRELAGTEAEDNEAMGGGGGDPCAVGLAMYRSVGRAAVADALAATQAMVADSAPLPPEHRRVHTSSRVLDAAECRRVIESSEAHAAQQGWSTGRHVAYPTTDLAVGTVGALRSWLPQAIAARLLPEFERSFGLAGSLVIEDLFVAKYEHGRQGQAGLEEHEDGNAWSFVLPLNPSREYEGGGTEFVRLEGRPVHRPKRGRAVMFSGKNRHRGRTITAGVRYILAGFLALRPAGEAGGAARNR